MPDVTAQSAISLRRDLHRCGPLRRCKRSLKIVVDRPGHFDAAKSSDRQAAPDAGERETKTEGQPGQAAIERLGAGHVLPLLPWAGTWSEPPSLEGGRAPSIPMRYGSAVVALGYNRSVAEFNRWTPMLCRRRIY